MLTAWRPFFNRYYCTHRSVLTLRDVSLLLAIWFSPYIDDNYLTRWHLWMFPGDSICSRRSLT